MTVRLKLLGAFLVLTVGPTLCCCASSRQESLVVYGGPRLEKPPSTDDFSNLDILEGSLEIAEEAFYEEDEELLPRVIENLKGNAVDLYQLHREAMNSKHRLRLMRLFLKVGDKEILPAFQHCLEDAAASELHRNPVDLVVLLDAYRRGEVPFLAADVLGAFRSLRAHTGAGRHLVAPFVEAISFNPQREWVPQLLDIVAQPAVNPESLSDDPEAQQAAIDPYRDQVFWQLGAIEALGTLQEAEAVPLLVETMLSGEKAEFASSSRLTLLRVGGPAIEYVHALLQGEHESLLSSWEVSRRRSGDEGGRRSLTLALVDFLAAARSAVGTSDAIAALNEELSVEERVRLARSLPNFGSNASIIEAFQRAFEAIDCAKLIEGDSACLGLASVPPYFFESSMVPWILEQARQKRADRRLSEELRGQVANALAGSALRLGGPEHGYLLVQVAKQNDLSLEVGALVPFVEGCGTEPSCFLDEVVVLEGQTSGEQWLAQRSLVALATLGGRGERDTLMELLPSLNDHETLALMLRLIDRLTPQREDQLVGKLAGYVGRLEADRSMGEFRTWIRELLHSIEGREKLQDAP